ncbi:MAG: DUF2007 domain-containing protein [Clostridiales bacterium]|nr:DUF2007 domain-containing protein [Clostridiales bacterium]
MVGSAPSWKVLYIAPNETWAQMVKELLEEEGFLVMLRPGGVPHMGPSAPYDVLVPESEAAEAHEVLTAFLASPKKRRLRPPSDGL